MKIEGLKVFQEKWKSSRSSMKGERHINLLWMEENLKGFYGRWKHPWKAVDL